MGAGDHRCEWRDEVERIRANLGYAAAALETAEANIAQLQQQLREKDEALASVQATVEELQRHVFGQRSEKMPTVAEATRDPARAETDRIAALRKRRENAEKKRQLVTRKIEHKVREDQKTCRKCGGHEFAPLGEGKLTELDELVTARVERQLHVQEKLRCRCGETILTADTPLW